MSSSSTWTWTGSCDERTRRAGLPPDGRGDAGPDRGVGGRRSRTPEGLPGHGAGRGADVPPAGGGPPAGGPAHTNAPGSPCEKRWQDVERIRDAGIHVVTTLNVQHLESVADAVETITGAPVRERLPDDILALADEIELVDMSPHALRQRMRHGNVYPPERAAIALERFVTEPNLMALRDLSLRFVAGQVDQELEGAVARQGIGLPPVTERVMAVVDESPGCRRAVRRAASLASALHATLLAVAAETSGVQLSRDRQRDLQSNVDYAVDLGAEIDRVVD